jgi:aerobic-type carbon monoxide dehydrogenase small subunit (CoxS/CutS family)
MPRVEFTFNKDDVAVDTDEDELLLDTVRGRLGATSVRYSCGIGVCGTCTVLVDGLPVSSCLQFTAMSSGRDVRTAEVALGAGEGLARRVLESFEAARAYQCSYCIPGMALTVASVLEQEPGLDLAGIRGRLGGNLCRCGSYPQVLEAVARVIAEEGDNV